MKEKELSIIIPIYNVEPFIKKCLDSIYSQGIDENRYEVIAINDGSPDNSLKIVEGYKETHKNLIIHSQKNGGLSRARNKGIELATGKYLWFVDSDDWLAGDAIEIVLDRIKGGYNVIATTLIYSYDDDSKNYLERTIPNDKIIEPAEYILEYSIGASQRYIIKREYLIKSKLEFYPGIYHEDGEFGPRLIATCKQVYLLAKPIYHYYQRDSGSIMSSWKLKNTTDLIFISQKIFEFSQNIYDKKIKGSLKYASFRTLMFAFSPKHVSQDKQIKELYNKTIPLIRKSALSALFSRGIKIKKRILALASIINPTLFYSLK